MNKINKSIHEANIIYFLRKMYPYLLINNNNDKNNLKIIITLGNKNIHLSYVKDDFYFLI